MNDTPAIHTSAAGPAHPGDGVTDRWQCAAIRAPWLAGLSALVLVIVVSGRPQGVHFYDQAVQSTALQQWLDGVAPNPNTLVRADPQDLTRDAREWLSWWPPSLQLLAAPLAMAGLSIGAALRTIFAGALIAGAIGWMRWMAPFRLPAPWIVILALSLPWLRHASENAFRYSAEILSFALAPWLLLLLQRTTTWIAQTSALGRLALAGFAIGCSYAAKYSLFVALACAGLFVAWETRAHWLHGPRRGSARVNILVVGACALVIPLGLRALNAASASSDPISFQGDRAFDFVGLVFAIANPALALADAQGPLFHAFVFPAVLLPPGVSQTLGGVTFIAWLAFPAGLLLAWLLARFWRAPANRDDGAGRLAVATLALNTAALFVLWQIAEVDHMARHVAPAALAALPVALREGLDCWRTRAGWLRPVLAVAAIGFVAGPLAYGFVYVGAKVHSTPSDYRTGRSGLQLPAISRTDVPQAIAGARRLVPPGSIWLIEDPEMALEVPGRFLLTYGDRSVGREMRRLERGPWRQPDDLATSKPVTLAVLLERRSDDSADLGSLRRLTDALPAAGGWQRHDIPAASFVLWTGKL